MNEIDVPKWLIDNEDKISKCFPSEWTLLEELNSMKLIFDFKAAGVPFVSRDDLVDKLVLFSQVGIVLHKEDTHIKANPGPVLREIL